MNCKIIARSDSPQFHLKDVIAGTAGAKDYMDMRGVWSALTRRTRNIMDDGEVDLIWWTGDPIDDDDGKFASNCKETLQLLSLYGEEGSRGQDPEVIKLLQETTLLYNAKPIKRLLKLLREAHTKWCNEHPASS